MTAPGNVITLAASAARTAGANGTSVDLLSGHWIPRAICVLLITSVHATDAGDTLDVYVDVSPDETTWINAGHFTQIAGNATPPITRWLWLSNDGAPGTADILLSTDAASGAVRPYAILRYIRARWAIADVGGDDASHTFAVTAQLF